MCWRPRPRRMPGWRREVQLPVQPQLNQWTRLQLLPQKPPAKLRSQRLHSHRMLRKSRSPSLCRRHQMLHPSKDQLLPKPAWWSLWMPVRPPRSRRQPPRHRNDEQSASTGRPFRRSYANLPNSSDNKRTIEASPDPEPDSSKDSDRPDLTGFDGNGLGN